MTNAEVRHKVASYESLENAFYWLQRTGKLNYDFARILSKEALRRAGINLKGKEVHHRIPLRRGLTLENILNLNNLQALSPQQHKAADSELKRQEKPICENKEHNHFRLYKKTATFVLKKYRKFKKEKPTLERKAKAFDDACSKLGNLKSLER